MNPGNFPPPTQLSGPLLTSEEKNWAMGCHLASLSGFIGVPFGNIIGPLIVWLIKKDSSNFVDYHGKESLNFHLTFWIYGLVLGALCFTIVLIPLIIILAVVLYGVGLVCSIMGAVKASNGEPYQYPMSIRFFS